jgi:hypothetical protein
LAHDFCPGQLASLLLGLWQVSSRRKAAHFIAARKQKERERERERERRERERESPGTRYILQ